MTLQTNNNNLDITKLAYEKINDRYYKAKYGEFDVIMNMTTGYINATKLCADGGKHMKNWTRNESNKELIDVFNKKINNPLNFEPVLISDDSYGITRGTYVHPKLITHIASWVSPSFAWKVSEIVNNFLVKEKEDEIRKTKILLGEKDCKIEELKIMFQQSEKRREEERNDRVNAEKRAEQMLLKMTLQNEKTHSKLDKTHTKLDKTKDILKRVETRVEKIVEEVVPPTKQTSLHEQFGIMKLNDSDGKRHYKVYCCQTRAVNKAKTSILKTYPQAVLLKEVSPNANAKNFLYQLKEQYGSGKKCKIQVSYNFINLKDGVTEEELISMVKEVVDNGKNYGNEYQIYQIY
jgi:hypothetical protein